MDGILRVTPEQLSATAGEFSSKASVIGNLTSEMTSKVTGLSSVWEGSAATAYINKFKGLEDDIQKMIRMVQEHAKDLEDMAANYNAAENEAESVIENLSSDVII